VRGKSGLKTAVDQCLSIPFRNTRDLELQLFELHKLRYLGQASGTIGPESSPVALRSPPAKPGPAAFLDSCRGYRGFACSSVVAG
jgi:hypothetical protein